MSGGGGRYAVRWASLDGSGESGYLRSFADRGEAVAYASEYAGAVAARGHLFTFGGDGFEEVCVLIAEKADGYRERITVSEAGA